MILDFSKREKECFDVLTHIPKERYYVIIGGYAVTSYGFPRFSVDLDVVIPGDEISFFQELLSKNGFVVTKEKEDLAYSGRFERYEKDLVSIDLLINGVQSRQTGYQYPFEYIFKNAQFRETSGWDPTHKVKVRIASKEMLIALKTHSMRTADIRDIIMLCYELPDIQTIVNHLHTSPKKTISDHITKLLTILDDTTVKDSLKGVYSIDEKIYKRTTENCIHVMTDVKNQLL